MKYIVDRIEGENVVCEALDKSKISFPLTRLFLGVKEGDHFELFNGKCVFLEKDTASARNKNIILQKKLFED